MSPYCWLIAALFLFALLAIQSVYFTHWKQSESLKLTAVIWRIIAISALIFVCLVMLLLSLLQKQQQLEEDFRAFSARSPGHAYAIAIFRSCKNSGTLSGRAVIRPSTSVCQIDTINQLRRSVYHLQSDEIKRDLLLFLRTATL